MRLRRKTSQIRSVKTIRKQGGPLTNGLRWKIRTRSAKRWIKLLAKKRLVLSKTQDFREL